MGGEGKGGEGGGRGGGRRREGCVEAKHFQTRTLSRWDWRSWAHRVLVSLGGRLVRLVGVRWGDAWRKLEICGVRWSVN